MGKHLELTPRLRQIAAWVRQGAHLADVGTDHAYLPVWLTLQGRVRSDLVINRALVAAGLDRFQFVKVADETRPELDAVRLASERTLAGLFVNAVLRSGADPQAAEGALRAGLAAISGEELKFDED